MARPSAEEPQRHRTNYRQLFSFAVVSGLICWLIEYPIQPVFAATNQNQLLVGETALLETASLIPLQEPQDFDGLTTEEVLRLRMQTVWQQPLLIGKDYEPTELIFGRLRNRADWRINVSAWTSSQNNDGLSLGSQIVLNPYLLVAVEVQSEALERLFRVEADGAVQEQSQHVVDLAWPFRPKSLTWYPWLARAEVVYDAAEFLSRVNRNSSREVLLQQIPFGLSALNAWDMNLNFAAILPQESMNLKAPQSTIGPVLIEQYFRFSKNCGSSGGCNELSPVQADLAGITLQQLPAGLEVRLWKTRPEDISQLPDLRFLLRFE